MLIDRKDRYNIFLFLQPKKSKMQIIRLNDNGGPDNSNINKRTDLLKKKKNKQVDCDKHKE